MIAALLSGGLFHGVFAYANLLSLSPKPLFIGGSVSPNVFFTLDDSGSMDWEFLTQRYWQVDFYDYDTGTSSSTPTDNYYK